MSVDLELALIQHDVTMDWSSMIVGPTHSTYVATSCPTDVCPDCAAAALNARAMLVTGSRFTVSQIEPVGCVAVAWKEHDNQS